MFGIVHVLALLSFSSLAVTKCYDPSPAFPLPLWEDGAEDLKPAFGAIAQKLKALGDDEKYGTSSFSVEVTSNTDTLWTHFHTAHKQSKDRPGVKHVDGESLYRIASITKTFTTLALLYQQKAGNLSLEDPVDHYIAELADADSGAIPWKDITLRSMASQLSGIPREMAQADLINELPDPTEVGLPPTTKEGLPHCYQYNDYIPCNRTELLENLKKKAPVFAPNQKSTYSNVNFELLGLVIEDVTGMSYSDYIREAIFKPLDMSSSSLETPSDTHAVLPLGQFFWDVDEGVHAPTGGIFSSSNDMSKYVRYILTHFNALATGINWIMPASWAGGVNSFYGMPFEIFRTDAILQNTNRPVTFVTKAGGVPSYFSRITLMPEYGLGLTILIGGSSELLNDIQEAVTVELIRAAESLMWKNVDKTYSGTYVATNTSLISSLELVSSPSTGLILKSFISNGTDVFASLLARWAGATDDEPWHAQLIPTLLYKNETTQQGEIWRLLVVPERQEGVETPIWDDFCITDVDAVSYAGLPINEIVFRHDEDIVEMPAWHVSLKRIGEGRGVEKLVVQQH